MRTKHSAALEEPADSRRGQLVRPVVALVIVFTLAAVAQSELRGREQRARHTELELTWIRSRASLVALHEDRAVDDAFLSSGIDLRIDALDRDIDGAVDRLPRDGHVAAVKGALRSFRAAVREAVGLVKAGEIRQARLLDSEKVDLWYEELNRAVDEALAFQRTVARRTERLTTTGSLATLAVACVAIGALLLRFERARQATLQIRQRALRDSEARFRALVQNSEDAITVVDVGGLVRYQSPAGLRVFGVEADAAAGVSFASLLEDLVHPRDLADALDFLRRALADSATSRCEFRVRSGVDEWRDVECSATNCLDDSHVGGIVVTSRDVTRRKVLEERLRFQAFHDPLTHLPNRTLLLDRLEVALARRAHHSSPLAVLLLDLDGFKDVNDTLGHAAGDDLLVQVAERLQECVRAADSVARLGGDEFAVLLEELSHRDDARVIAERMIELISAPFPVEGREMFLGASVGIVVTFAQEVSPVEVMRDADVAMYAAKSEGKNRIRFFEPSMRAAVVNRMTLESDLRNVVEHRQLTLHYQPVVDLATGRIAGVEALARWRHPERGLVAPVHFIPIAEETGLIVDIGGWALRAACEQIRAWQRRYPDEAPLGVSVNLSGRQLQHPGLVDDLHEILDATGIEPSTLMLEITESVLMRHTGRVEASLAGLRALGVRLAIDDFGTGYSSLGYLQSFPIDILKIDRSFIMRVARGPEESALARAIIKLAHNLDLVTVAEGVEDEQQVLRLRDLGCPLAQGYYFARPLDAAAMDDVLRVAAHGEVWAAGPALAPTG